MQQTLGFRAVHTNANTHLVGPVTSAAIAMIPVRIYAAALRRRSLHMCQITLGYRVRLLKAQDVRLHH